MANPAVNTAVCQCTFGAAPAPLTVTSQNTVTGCNMPVATIMDIPKPPMTFGMCSSLANPTVASATAAAIGEHGRFKEETGKPLLNNTSKCMCSWGGVISVTATPAVTINVP